MAGPRFSYRKLNGLVPFAQALFGGSHFSASSGGITGGGNEFAFGLGGGADLGLGSSRKFGLRPGGRLLWHSLERFHHAFGTPLRRNCLPHREQVASPG